MRKTYTKVFNVAPLVRPECIQDADVASQLMYDKLMSQEPCMIARFGAYELSVMVNYLGIKKSEKKVFAYIKGEGLEWWWNKKLLRFMHLNAGFFPPTVEKIEQFCELMLKDIPEVDILGFWVSADRFKEELRNSRKILLEHLNPYFSTRPWTKALEGKKVLVVHPFAQTIASQYKKRELLFENKDILPIFDLKVLKAVQSLGKEKTPFADWFDALNYMKNEIDKVDYDICLIGCGAYGFPLAAHVKRTGKKAVHLGGCLQLLFGIRGKRWENPNYNKEYNYSQLMNEHWVRPAETEKPGNADRVEGACYW